MIPARRVAVILCVLPVVLSPVPVIAQLRTLEISFDVSGLASDGDGSNRTVRVGGDPLKFKMVIKNLTTILIPIV